MRLHVRVVRQWQGVARGTEGQKICWVDNDKLQEYRFPQANRSIVMTLSLPEYYFVTPQQEIGQVDFLENCEKIMPGRLSFDAVSLW